VSVQNVQDVTITRKVMDGKGNKAIALGQEATGVTVVDDNTIGPRYRRAVGFDDPSARPGYRGPPVP
jgi:hypothetical protein